MCVCCRLYIIIPIFINKRNSPFSPSSNLYDYNYFVIKIKKQIRVQYNSVT